MKFGTLGKAGPLVSRLGIGCMGMAELYGKPQPQQLVVEMLSAAYTDYGVTFFDTADMYGKGRSEQILGAAVKPFRDKVIIASKCGLYRTDAGVGKALTTETINTPHYIQSACASSLKNLGTTYIDVYYLHRHDPAVAIEDAMQAMQDLIAAGKIRYVGLSETNPAIIRRAHKILGAKLIAVQTEFSFINRGPAAAVLPTCRELGVAFVPYSPLGRGILASTKTSSDLHVFGKDGYFDIRTLLPQYSTDNLKTNLELVDAIRQLATAKQHTAAQYALAWLLAQGDDIFPIPGISSAQHLQENMKSADIALSSADLTALDTLYRTYPISGLRLPQAFMEQTGLVP